jgi:hypothetical protein
MDNINRELSVIIDEGGTSQAVAISGTSAQSAAIAARYAVVTLTTGAFLRRGSNPTALSDGTDRYLPAGIPFRVELVSGNKLAFKTSGASGTAYITPEA